VFGESLEEREGSGDLAALGGGEVGRESLAHPLVDGVLTTGQRAPARGGDAGDHAPRVDGVPLSRDKTSPLEGAERRSNRLRSDALDLCQLARAQRAVAVETGEHRDLEQPSSVGVIAGPVDLPDASCDPANRKTQVKGCTHRIRSLVGHGVMVLAKPA